MTDPKKNNNKQSVREALKAKIKEYIRKQIKEISASGAAGGGTPGDGSAGPVKTPFAFSAKNKGDKKGAALGGYEKVESKEKSADAPKKKAEKPPVEKSADAPAYKPIVAKPVVAAPTDQFKKVKTQVQTAADALKKLEKSAPVVSPFADKKKTKNQ